MAYVDCPVDIAAWRAAQVDLYFDGVRLGIAPGVACVRTNGAPEVMRGEETQVFGAMTLAPYLGSGKHRVVLPGTHSKWVDIEDGRIVSFTTFFTGEMFALLRDHSTLAGLGGGGDVAGGFEAGLARSREGGAITGAVFEARSAQLRAQRTPAWALEFLSGLLIGHEVAVFTETPVLIGEATLTERYAQALQANARQPKVVLNGDDCAIAGVRLLEDRSDAR